jgi:hypothetical protein
MKTINSLLVVTAVTLLLAAATALRAGPPPDLQNRTRPMIHESAKADTIVKTDVPAKTDANKIPALCAQMPNCGCAAMAAKNAKS